MEIAAFDFDGTLTVRDCVIPFMRRVGGQGALVSAIAKHPSSVGKSALRRDRDSLKQIFVREVFRGRDAEEVRDEGMRFASFVAQNWMRGDVGQRLRIHQALGHVVVIVSASLEPYLGPLGDLLGVDAVLCTRLEESNGRFTGALRGANCRGIEKVSRLSRWMSDSGWGERGVRFAYGDSSGDREMLKMAAQPFHVGRRDLNATGAE